MEQDDYVAERPDTKVASCEDREQAALKDDRDAETIKSTRRTLNQVMLILARGHALRPGGQARGRVSLGLLAGLLVAGLVGAADPAAIVAVLPGG